MRQKLQFPKLWLPPRGQEEKHVGVKSWQHTLYVCMSLYVCVSLVWCRTWASDLQATFPYSVSSLSGLQRALIFSASPNGTPTACCKASWSAESRLISNKHFNYFSDNHKTTQKVAQTSESPLLLSLASLAPSTQWIKTLEKMIRKVFSIL